MKSLKELASVSTFRPQSGPMAILFDAVLQDYSRPEVEAIVSEHTGQFRKVLMNLKNNLVDGSLRDGYKKYSEDQQKRIRIYKNMATCQSLYFVDLKDAWAPLAGETCSAALKIGELGIAHTLAKELKYYYSVFQTDTTRYNFYSRREAKLSKLYREEELAFNLFADITFNVRQNREGEGIEERIAVLEEIAETNDQYKFHLAFRTAQTTWLQYQNKEAELFRVCDKALRFFDSYDKEVPYTTVLPLYLIKIPSLLKKKNFPKASAVLNKSMELPEPGSYNWHLVIIHQAITGFHSNKLPIAYNYYKLAKQTPKRFKKNPYTEEHWEIIRAYLALFRKMGRIQYQENWRLGKFLNSVPTAEQDKRGQNVAIIIAKLLHLLFDGRKREYMEASEHLDRYTQTHLKGQINIRSRAILKWLRAVELADYNLLKLEILGKRHLTILQKHPISTDVNFLEAEFLPFERVVGEVREILK